jgi:hypothetical protein
MKFKLSGRKPEGDGAISGKTRGRSMVAHRFGFMLLPRPQF